MNRCENCDAWEAWAEVEVGGEPRRAGECRARADLRGEPVTARLSQPPTSTIKLPGWPLRLADSGCRDDFRPRAPAAVAFDLAAFEAYLAGAFPGSCSVLIDLTSDDADGTVTVTGTVTVHVQTRDVGPTRAAQLDWPNAETLATTLIPKGVDVVDVDVIVELIEAREDSGHE